MFWSFTVVLPDLSVNCCEKGSAGMELVPSSFSPHSAAFFHPLSPVLQFIKRQLLIRGLSPIISLIWPVWSKLYVFIRFIYSFIFFFHWLVPFQQLCLMIGIAALKDMSEACCRNEGKEEKYKRRWKLTSICFLI